MPFFASRRRGTGRLLDWKVRLFFVGAVLLLVGMVREIDLLVLTAIAVLAVAFALRFFEGEKADETPADEEEDGEDEGYAGELPPPAELRDTGPVTRPMREEPRRPGD